MTIPSILNVAISLIFIYVTLSVFVSGIQERITSLFQWRASHLKSCIINLLDHHVTDQFYHHPLIESLNQSDTQWWQKFLPWKTDPIGPSYIDSQTFSTVLLDILNENYNINLNEYTENIDNLVEKLNTLKQEQKKTKSDSLPNGISYKFINILSILARQVKYEERLAAVTLKDIKQELSQWFDQSMERSAGVYKRYASGVTLLISIVISVGFNVDTVYIVNQLYNNPDISSAISQLATQKIELITEQCSAETAEPNCFEQTISNISASQIRAFPVGWKGAKITSVNDLFLALFGWIISAIAISQGAPFWFELLKQVVNVRDTGKIPQTFKEKMAQQD